MKQLNISEAKAQLSKLIDLAGKGESIVIAKAGKPLARLVPLSDPRPRNRIKFGTLKGKIWIPDDFDAPLPEEVLAAFEGSESG
jgi:prevent-host-death family protein